MRIWVPVVLLVCSLSGAARAGDKAAAEAAFQQGKDLMKAGKYAEACTAFEKSQANDPELGTEYNLATCYEKAGKLASAWAAFRELAQRDSNAARKADSDKHANALQPRLIKLLISVRAPVAGLKVTRNRSASSRRSIRATTRSAPSPTATSRGRSRSRRSRRAAPCRSRCPSSRSCPRPRRTRATT
jgi:hypothetical protein